MSFSNHSSYFFSFYKPKAIIVLVFLMFIFSCSDSSREEFDKTFNATFRTSLVTNCSQSNNMKATEDICNCIADDMLENLSKWELLNINNAKKYMETVATEKCVEKYKHTTNAEKSIEPDFDTGYMLGSLSSAQIEVQKAYLDLQIVNDESFRYKNKSSLKKLRITDLNIALSSIYTYKEQIPDNLNWPDGFEELLTANSEKMKIFYKKLKVERIENDWIDEDPENEKRINEILDIYIEYGNPYKLK